MRIYEELFILRPDVSEEQTDSVVDLIRNTVTGAKGAVDKVEKWGVRRLAYRVEKQNEGFYVLIQFSADPEAVREIERRLRVNDLVIKYLTVRIDEKLKWLEKRKRIRDKRAARRPQPPPPAMTPASAPVMPGLPAEPEAESGPAQE
jgi:small subunit ribosomal protein S6